VIAPRRAYSVPLPNRAALQLGSRTLVMAILNVTPDSFADGGRYLDPDAAVTAGLHLAEDGADIIDVGGESTRPGAELLPADEERRRVLPVIERLVTRIDIPLSIDTYKASVAKDALTAGASIVNDISGLLYDPDLGRVAATARAAVVLMHTRGRSKDMYQLAEYDDVSADVARELGEAIARAQGAGIARESIILDPGVGFAKRAPHSFEMLAHLEVLAALNRPLLVGPSRKSFLKEALGDRAPADREWGTAAAVTASVLHGAHIVRVHDVRDMIDVVRVADRIRMAGLSNGSE